MENLQEIDFVCPYCWETVQVLVAPSELPAELIEDCSVCCHPIQLRLELSASGEPQVAAEAAQ